MSEDKSIYSALIEEDKRIADLEKENKELRSQLELKKSKQAQLMATEIIFYRLVKLSEQPYRLHLLYVQARHQTCGGCLITVVTSLKPLAAL